MELRELANHRELRPLELPLAEVPHVVIEPNTTCDLECTACYRSDRAHVKPLAQVKDEVDLALRLRQVETVSLLGGEPTLHPDLPAIVAHVKARRALCQVLTNGVRLAGPGGESLLEELLRAGVDRIVLHADEGQARGGPSSDEVCELLFPRFDRRRLPFSLAVTVYPGSEGALASALRRFARFRHFDGLLATLARDPRAALSPQAAPPEPELGDVHRALEQALGVAPAAYLPSSHDDRRVCWLLYFYYLDPCSGATLSVSPRLNRLARRVYRCLTGRHLFGLPGRASLTPLTFLATCAAELALRPARAPGVFRTLLAVARSRRVRFHYVVLQSGPEFRGGVVELCHHCPDATIRDGRLTPVCLADLLHPLGGAPAAADAATVRAVDAHLGWA